MKSKYRDGVAYGHDQPSEAQAKAGNYAKGHQVIHGMRISVEHEAGTTRQGKSEGGTVWESKMSHDYGYIRGSKGKDKDHIDVFLGPDPHNKDLPAHVIDQDHQDGSFDEHKVMLGFPDASAAQLAYHENYEPGWGGFRASTEMSVPQLRDWAYSGKSGKRKPASELSGFQKEPSTMPQSLAVGGTVNGAALTGSAPVGLGTFGAAPQGTQVTAPSAGTGMGAPAGQLSGSSGAQPPGPPPGLGAVLPQGQATAPGFDTNTPGGLGFLNMTLGAGGAGTATDNGVAAFMPKNWGLVDNTGNTGMDTAGTFDTSRSANDIVGLAKKIGFDTSKYDLSNTNGLAEADYGGRDIARGLQSSAAASQQGNGVAALYQALNSPDVLGKYQRIGGMSAGWDGHPVGDRSASDTMYRNDGGVYTPQGASGHYRAPTNPGWIKGEGADFIQAMSMMLPAVGGWAGLANSAGVGATSAGLEAGSAGATALNAGINAAGSTLLGGNPVTSLAGSLGGYAGGAAGNAIGGQDWAGLGSQLGSRALSTIASRVGTQRKKAGGPVYGPLAACHQQLADGGSVDDPSQAYVGYRSAGPRPEANNDREGAKQIGPSLLRGFIANTLGMGGDVEGLGRKILGVDETPALPTSDFYKDVLPFKPTSPAGLVAEGLGGLAGLPASTVALKGTRLGLQGARAALPAAQDALRGLSPDLIRLLTSLGQPLPAR